MDEREELARAILSKAGAYYGRRPFALHKAALYIAATRLGVGIRDVGAINSTVELDGADNPGIVVILSAHKGPDFVAKTTSAIEVMKLAGTPMIGAADVDTRFAQEIAELMLRPDPSAPDGHRSATMSGVVMFAGVGVFGTLIRRAAGQRSNNVPAVVVPGQLLADGRERELDAFIRDERNWRTADAG